VLLAALSALVALGLSPAAADTFSSPATGTHQVVGAILDRYRALGGPTGFLGYPLTDERATPRVSGRYNHFQGGSIYWSPATGAHQVGGAIRDRWAALGWENGPLGFPTTDERPTADGVGRTNTFQGGALLWSPATGTRWVGGAIWRKYAALGGDASVLGLPTTDELTTPNLQGRYILFQRGAVVWSPASGAHPVHGAIQARWGAMGAENSVLGFPTSDEYAIAGGRAQDFQYGRITWTAGGGAVVTGAPKAGGGQVPLGVTPPGTQLVTVVAPSAGSTTATLTAWEKRATGWTAVLGPVTARVGSAGIGVASETTSRTPAGTWTLTEGFGRLANPGTALPYRVIDGSDWWVSDVTSDRYNRYHRCAPGTCPFDERAGERLTSAGAVYDNAVVIDYNRGGVRGAGSAFFLHITNNAATAGCVAIARGDLQALMRWLNPAARPVIAIGVG
jgi:L,D-peptidoglycan transpeptidase YkuD (ErfK/YbiS/YcfS/YnhG family)